MEAGSRVVERKGKVKGIKYMVLEDDLTSIGRHTMQYIDHSITEMYA